jgi:hypothetical protein
MKKKRLIESRVAYSDKHKERINPIIVDQLRKREHSLGDHPIFPESDEQHFEEKLISDRFLDLVKNYKRQFDVDEIQDLELTLNTMKHLRECMTLEQGHEKELVEIAVNMVRKEFDVTEEDVIIEAELTHRVDGSTLNKNKTPIAVEGVEFDNHDEIQKANKEVYKRRFINAMIQGSSKKCSHMFHLVEDEIADINPRLNANYSKMMAGADLMYMTMEDKMLSSVGGLVQVEFPQSEEEPSKIIAKAVTFPVLIHEIVKGVMELLASHGLPKDKHITEYVIGKADFTAAEPWDMRLGPSIWEKFTDCIDVDDFDIKHHIFAELVSLDVDDFNRAMREIMAGTKEGKRIVQELTDEIKEEIRKDDFNMNLANGDYGDDDYFTPGELDDFDPSFLR